MEVDSGMSMQYGTTDPSDNPATDQVELSVDQSSSQGSLSNDAHAANPNPTMVHIADHEAEVTLDHDHPESDWTAFEERLQQTNMMIAFSINDATILVPNQGFWGLPELATGITQVAESKGVCFDAPGLLPTDGQVTKLLGRPNVNDRALWKLLRRGYIKVHEATIWVSPEFTGRRQSNLDLIEVEYSNANYVSVKDLHAVLQRWGAREAIIVSHSASRMRHGKWPAIACVINAVTDPTTGDPKFAFRLLRMLRHCEPGLPSLLRKRHRPALTSRRRKNHQTCTRAERRMEQGPLDAESPVSGVRVRGSESPSPHLWCATGTPTSTNPG